MHLGVGDDLKTLAYRLEVGLPGVDAFADNDVDLLLGRAVQLLAVVVGVELDAGLHCRVDDRLLDFIQLVVVVHRHQPFGAVELAGATGEEFSISL
jgi:hypothetical protein